MKKSSFIFGFIGSTIGIFINGFLTFSLESESIVKMFAILALIFSIISFIGVFIDGRINSIPGLCMFLGTISNMTLAIINIVKGNIIIGILGAATGIMLLLAGIVSLTKKKS